MSTEGPVNLVGRSVAPMSLISRTDRQIPFVRRSFWPANLDQLLTSPLLLVLLVLPFFVALDGSSIWDSNEAFYVETPREMMERGEWVVPYFNGEMRLNKPPLSYWLVGIGYQVFGVSIWVERFLMAILACGSIAACYRIGVLLFNSSVGLLGAGILATTFRFLILSRRLFIDVLLLACLLAAIAFFAEWVYRRKPWAFHLFCLCIGLGVLTKGPVALLPLPPLGLFLLARGELRRIREGPWFLGGLIALATAGSWFVLLAVSLGWDPVIKFFLEENLSRFSSRPYGPSRGLGYYFVVFLTDFAPWSFLFPAAFFWWTRKWADGGWKWPSPRMVLLASWIGIYFVFFSLSLNKQEYYILPLYPAAAVWIAYYLTSVRASSVTSFLAAVPTGLGAVVFVLIAITLEPGNIFLWIPSVFLLAASIATLLRRFRLVVPLMALFYLGAFSLYLSPLERYRPVRPLSREIQVRTEGMDRREYKAGYYRLTAPSMAYYLGPPVLELYDPEEAIEVLDSDTLVYLVMQAGDYVTLNSRTLTELQIVEVRPKLYTTARNFQKVLSSGDEESWTRPVYLVTNRRGD